jgi:hypothetical protein
MDRRVHQLGGVVLFLAGMAAAAGGALHPLDAGILAEFGGMDLQWRVSQFAILFAGPLFVLSTIFLARHFASAAGEGLALLGTGSLLLGGLALAVVGGGNVAWLMTALGRGGSVGAEDLAGGNALLQSTVGAVGFLFPLSIAAFGAAMVRHGDWPGWLAWAGVAIGTAFLTIQFFDIPLGPGSSLPHVLAYEWFAVVGIVFVGKTRERTAAEAPPLETPSDEETVGSKHGEPSMSLEEALGFIEAVATIKKMVPTLALAHQTTVMNKSGDGDDLFPLLPDEIPPNGSRPVPATGAWEEGGENGDDPANGRPSYLSVEEELGLSTSRSFAPIPMNHSGNRDRNGSGTNTVPDAPVLFEFVMEGDDEETGTETVELSEQHPAVQARSEAFHNWLSGPH